MIMMFTAEKFFKDVTARIKKLKNKEERQILLDFLASLPQPSQAYKTDYNYHQLQFQSRCYLKYKDGLPLIEFKNGNPVATLRFLPDGIDFRRRSQIPQDFEGHSFTFDEKYIYKKGLLKEFNVEKMVKYFQEEKPPLRIHYIISRISTTSYLGMLSYKMPGENTYSMFKIRNKQPMPKNFPITFSLFDDKSIEDAQHRSLAVPTRILEREQKLESTKKELSK